MSPDGKHPGDCSVCGRTHYRRHPMCRTCQSARDGEPDGAGLVKLARWLDLDQLMVFVDEAHRRHQEHSAKLKRLGGH